MERRGAGGTQQLFLAQAPLAPSLGTRATPTAPASMIVRAQGPQVNPRGSLLQPTRVQKGLGQLQDPSGGTQHFAGFT